jgi:hypothetical protein
VSDTEQPKAKPRGWGWPFLSKKAHYFVDSRALCGKWMFTGELTSPDDVGGRADDCRGCCKKLTPKKAAS